MSHSIICNRSFEFAYRILRLADKLSQRGGVARHVANQLMRCGTSVGSNAEEAQEGQSKRDFIAKMNISRKEARETRYWLRLALKAGIVSAAEIRWELDEIGQLWAMIRSAVLTARKSLKTKKARGGSSLIPHPS
jgi:four helix bundle protein